MTYFADEASAAAAVRNPATSRADLMSIAYAYPVLGVEVARHPNVYPGLLDWLEQFGTPKTRAEVAAVRAETPAPIYRPTRQDVDAPKEAAPARSTWTPPKPATPAPAPASTPPVTRAEVPTVPVRPAAARVASETGSSFADAPTAPIPVQTAPIAPTATLPAQPAPAATVAAPSHPTAARPSGARTETVAETAEYVSPFDEYDDEPEPQVDAHTAHDSEDDIDKPWSTAKKGVLIGVIAAVVVVAAVLGFIFGYKMPHQRALDSAQASFQTASQAFQEAQTGLTTQIQAANAVSSVQTTDVKNATTLSDLSTALANAQSLMTAPPTMASTATDINQQVTDLTTQTASINSATQTLQTAIDGVQQSRVDLAVDNLKAVLADAQSSYDSANWMATTTEGKTLLPELKTLIDQAMTATNDPATLGADTDSIVAALQTLTPNLQKATDDLNAEAARVTANKTYTYLLSGDQVSCGVNICYNGVGGGDPSTVESVQVTVKGSTVTAKLCFMSNVAVDPTTCQPTPGTQANLYGWSEAWTGTRDGTTVKIVSTTKDMADFSWGTITFASSAPNAEATKFAAADGCEKSDGSGYGQLVNGSCQ